MNFKNLANSVIQHLNEKGVECYLWHVAKHGSAYIRFKDNRLGSIRLGDHKGRKKLAYRWNIRSDFPIGHHKWHEVKGNWRYYVHSDCWGEIITHILKRQKMAEDWEESKFSYCIPRYKWASNKIKFGYVKK